MDLGSFDLNAIIESIRAAILGLIEQIRTLIADIRLGNEPGAPTNPEA